MKSINKPDFCETHKFYKCSTVNMGRNIIDQKSVIVLAISEVEAVEKTKKFLTDMGYYIDGIFFATHIISPTENGIMLL